MQLKMEKPKEPVAFVLVCTTPDEETAKATTPLPRVCGVQLLESAPRVVKLSV